MRVVASALVALAFVSASGAPAAPAVQTAGLRGVVMRGPIRPVCIEDEPCDGPAAGVVLRFSRAGAVVARVTTGAAGGYRIRLRPGVYTVSTPRRGLGSGLTPRVVRVPTGRFARVDFHIDTGIQ